MAFDPTPSTWLGAGYTLGSNQAKFTTASAGSNVTATELTDAEANPTTGDIRKIFYALCAMMYAAWLAVSSGNRPQRMTLQRQTVVDDTAGTSTVVFSFSFVTQTTAQDVAAEPS